MRKFFLFITLFVYTQFIYSQEYTLKDLKVNGKVKKMITENYISDQPMVQFDTVKIQSQSYKFFNEIGNLTLDSAIYDSGQNYRKGVYKYDSLNRLIQVFTYKKGFEDQNFCEYGVTEYRYDQNGNVIFEKYNSASGVINITKYEYNQQNKIILYQSYFIRYDSDTNFTSPTHIVYEYIPRHIIDKQYDSDSILVYLNIIEFEDEKCDKYLKIYSYLKIQDSLELFEKTEFYYEDSTKIKITKWIKNKFNFSITEECHKYYDTNRRLIKQKYYKKEEKQTEDEYFYDENGNCIKKATHYSIPESHHTEFMYVIYKYEFY